MAELNGGLLAGIGMANSNAPQSNDINPTLGLIQQNNERQRSGANNVGLQLLQGLGGVASAFNQADQAQSQADFNQQYAKAFASGDRSAMRNLVAKYPSQFDAVQKGMGFIDQDQRDTVGSLAASARIAAQNPEMMGNWLQSNAGDLNRVGINPQDVAQMYQQNPQGFSEFADHLGLAALGPEKYYAAQDAMVGRGIAQQNANTSAYSAQQNAQQGAERLDIDRFKAQTDTQLRTRELALKAQLGRADNDLAREKIQADIGKVQQAQQEKKIDKINTVTGNIDNLNQALKVGTELSNIVGQHPTAVSRNQGGILGKLPNLTDDTKALESKTNEYNLKVILPALRGTFGGNPTEGERAALMQSQNNLKGATSNAEFMKELNKAQDTVVRMQKRQISELGIPVTRSKDEATDVQMLMQDPSLIKEYIMAHGYLPEAYYQQKMNGG